MSAGKKLGVVLTVAGLAGIATGVARKEFSAPDDYEACLGRLARQTVCSRETMKFIFVNGALTLGGLFSAVVGAQVCRHARRKEEEVQAAAQPRAARNSTPGG